MSEQGSLYHIFPDEVSPPPEVWKRITSSLDDERKIDVFARINAMEMLPPESIWDNLSSKLHEEESNSKFSVFFELANAEVAPPESIWQNINQQLGSTKVIPLKTGVLRKVLLGFTAAACVVGVLLLASLYTQTKEMPAPGDSVKDLANSSPNQVGTQLRPVTQYPTEHPNANPNSISLPSQSKKIQTPIFADNDSENYLVPTTDNSLTPINTANEIALNTEKQKDLFDAVPNRIRDYTTDNSAGYTMAIGPNGNSVMVSGKLSNMIEFFDDSDLVAPKEYIEIVFERSNYWKKKLITWIEILNSPAADLNHVNFVNPMDLIEFIHSQQKK